jgi:hypothetical protein
MKKNILIGVVTIVVIGGATYALVPRNVLKEYFERGDKPTEQQFSDTIDSGVNLEDDADTTGLKEYNPTKEYVVGDTEVKSAPIYQAKIVTENQKEFKLDAVQSVTFRWTPIVPKPAEPVTYRLKVWQLMQGQSGSQAMKTNQPIVTKEVTDISEVTVSDIYTGPCKPPYLCDYIWSVESTTTASSGTRPSETATPAATVPAQTDGTLDGTN